MMNFQARVARYLPTRCKLHSPRPRQLHLDFVPRRCLSSSSVDPNNAAATARLRRSVHFVPADNEKFLAKSLSLGADTVVLDLEDSVKNKRVGRTKLRSFLDSLASLPGRENTEVLVRINPLSGSEDEWRADIDAGFVGADGFMVPKVESRDELMMLDEILSNMERNQNQNVTLKSAPKVILPIATETPAAVLNIADIAKGPRVCAITWGCEDLSAAMGSFGTRKPNGGGYLDIFSHCQSMCLLAAKAANVQAIDGIYQNVRDLRGFEKEALEAKYMGFDGKLTLHPEQISVVHKVFEPMEAELSEAKDIVEMWEDGGGKGSLEYNGQMIDLPHYVRAKKVIARSTSRDNVQNDNNNAKRDATISMSGSERNETSSPNSKDTNENSAQTQNANANAKRDATIPMSGSERNETSSPNSEDTDDIFPRVYLGKYFEDLNPGLKIRHFLTRTVTESDNVFFTCLTLNPAPIHLDHELAKENASALSSGSEDAGKPLFNSMFTLALLVGMSVPESTHGTTVANLGFSEVLFPKPVYPGDTLRAETLVVDRRESKSRPTQGIVTLQHLAYNQRGEVVCKATRQALMKKRL